MKTDSGHIGHYSNQSPYNNEEWKHGKELDVAKDTEHGVPDPRGIVNKFYKKGLMQTLFSFKSQSHFSWSRRGA